MSQHRFSTPEASQALGIPVHVITYWLGQIPYPAEQDPQGQWRLTPEAMGVLQAVKDLKERNASMEEIRRHVRELQEAMPTPVASHPGPVTFIAPAPTVPDDRAWGIPAELKAASAAPKAAPAAPAGPAATKPPAPPQAARSKAPAKPQAPTAPPAPPQTAAPALQIQAKALAAAFNGEPRDLAGHVSRAVSEAVRHETVLAQRYAQAAHQIGRLEAENEHLKGMLTAANARATRDADDSRCRIAELEAAAKPKKTNWWAWLAIGALL